MDWTLHPRPVPRQVVIDAAEKAIEFAGDALTVAEQTMLRHVVATEPYLLRSKWKGEIEGVGLCGCPLTQAGIVQPQGAFSMPVPGQRDKYRPFWHTFDIEMAKHTGLGVHALRIEG